MPRTDVNVPTPDGECPSIVITPDGDGPWPRRDPVHGRRRRARGDGHDGRTARRDGLRRLPPRDVLPQRSLRAVRDGDRVHRRRRAPAPVRDDHLAHHGRRRIRCRSLPRVPVGAPPGGGHAGRDEGRHHRVLHGRAAVARVGGPPSRPDRRRRVLPRRPPRDRRTRQPTPPRRADHRARLRRRRGERRIVHRRRRRGTRRRAHRRRRRAHRRVLSSRSTGSPSPTTRRTTSRPPNGTGRRSTISTGRCSPRRGRTGATWRGVAPGDMERCSPHGLDLASFDHGLVGQRRPCPGLRRGGRRPARRDGVACSSGTSSTVRS